MDSLRHQKAVAGTVEEALMNITCENLDNLLAEGDSYSMQIATKHASGCPACMEKLASWNEISDVARGMHATRLWQIAAGLVLLAGMAVVAWKANQRMRAVEFDNAILRASAVDQVEQAEKVHLAAIDHLEKLVEPKLEEASTPLLVSYKEKLMLLDDAIVECQRNIGGNRQNAHLRKQLLAIYSEKQRTLQEVLREECHASNQ
jgi:hypothetical protein